MSHWKAACEDEELCKLYAKFIKITFRVSQLNDRWLVSYHAMIQKKDKPWANDMHIIQLLEGDYNVGLCFLIQREGVGYTEKNKLYTECTYEGLRGKNTHQVLGHIHATNEACQLYCTQRLW